MPPAMPRDERETFLAGLPMGAPGAVGPRGTGPPDATPAATTPGEDSGVALAAEAHLGFDLPPAEGPAPRPHDPEDVLLTGATGFVGGFLLDRLLRRTRARVHCPVRARDSAAARRRVLANLARYGLRTDGYADRLVCFPGDLTAPGLGVESERAAALAACLDLVVHSGAWVTFVHRYATLRPANVEGTREIVRLAAPRRVPVHFLSTVAVLAGFGTAGVRHVDEDRPLAYADRLTMGYSQSKWVAERLLGEAADRGLPVAVHRPYEITGDRHNGACDTGTAICSLFRTIAVTGLAPDIALPMDLVPVDYAADAIVHIATRRAPAPGRVYHLTNPEPAPLADVVDRLRAAGCAVRTLPCSQWVDALAGSMAREPGGLAAPLVSPYLGRDNASDLPALPSLGRRNLDAALAGSGLHCPPVDATLIDRYLEYLFASGYIRRPRPPAGPG